MNAMKYALLVSGMIVLTMIISACGGAPAATSTPAGAPQAAPTVAADAATITGKVNFAGSPPPLKKISMDAEPTCAQKYTDGPYAEDIVVNKENNTLRNVFVYVKEGLSGKTFPAPQQPVVLDQVGCHYVPHVMGIQVGQNLVIRNSDGILHNIHPKPKTNREFNIGQPRVMETTRTFDKPEFAIPVGCEVHSWMRAYIHVLDHPFFGVTGADGTFTINGLPPGDYTLEAWHEQYGPKTMKVTVGAKETKQVEFAYSGS